MATSRSRNGAAPKYSHVENAIRAKIESGTWTPGMAVPSERNLADAYGVARLTVRHAIGNLVTEGRLIREPSKGTFVARPRVRQALNRLIGFSEDMRNRGLIATTRVLGQEETTADPEAAAALAISVGTPILYLHRLRLASGYPMTIETCILRGDATAALATADLERQSLYRLLEECCGIELSRAGQMLEAGLATDAEAALLEVPHGAPVLHLRRTTYGVWRGREVPIEYARSVYRGDRYYFYIEVAGREKTSYMSESSS